MKTLLKPFGRYFLLDRIARGGMAEIFRARYAMVDSGARLMAIKCMAPELSNEQHLLDMFKAEVKLLLGMNHPNIVQFYDFGDGSSTKLEGQKRPYIAMEYLQGQSLRQVLASLRAHDDKRFPPRPFSIQFVLHIASQCCQALNYAHEFADPITGAPMKIIHRDVNPQNILVLYDGSVKIIDFGIAKTAFGEVTETGLIKGTPAYLAPEQIKLSRHLDRRCDVFSLGVVVWEMLTGQRLFRAQDDRATMLKIASSDQHVKPPSKFNPSVPPGLDQVVLKALAHDPDNRYTTAIDFETDLKMAFALHAGTQLKSETQAELGEFVRQLFAEEISREGKLIRELNQQAEEMIRAMGKSAPAQEDGSSRTRTNMVAQGHSGSEPEHSPDLQHEHASEDDAIVAAAAAAAAEAEAKDRERAKSARKSPESKENPREEKNGNGLRPSSRGGKDMSLVGPAAGSPLLMLDEAPQLRPGGDRDYQNISPKAERNAPSRGSRSGSSGSKSKRPAKGGVFGIPRKALVAAAAAAALYTFGDFKGFNAESIRQQVVGLLPAPKAAVDLAEAPPEQSITAPTGGREVASSKPVKADSFQVMLNIYPPGNGNQVRINGRFVPSDALATLLELPNNKPFSVSISRAGYAEWFGNIDPDKLRKDIANRPAADIRILPKRYGLLKVQTGTSAEVTIMVQGVPWTLISPIEGEKLPVGTYEIRVVNQIRNVQRDFVVQIEEGKIKEIHEDL